MVIGCTRQVKLRLSPVQTGSRLIRQPDGAATMAIGDQVLADGVFVHNIARVRPVDGVTRVHCGFDSFNVHVGFQNGSIWNKEPKHRMLERALALRV